MVGNGMYGKKNISSSIDSLSKAGSKQSCFVLSLNHTADIAPQCKKNSRQVRYLFMVRCLI